MRAAFSGEQIGDRQRLQFEFQPYATSCFKRKGCTLYAGARRRPLIRLRNEDFMRLRAEGPLRGREPKALWDDEALGKFEQALRDECEQSGRYRTFEDQAHVIQPNPR